MTWVISTKIIIALIIIFLCLYDIAAVYWGGKEAAISTVSYEFCCNNPIMAFAIGVVVGHVFWRD